MTRGSRFGLGLLSVISCLLIAGMIYVWLRPTPVPETGYVGPIEKIRVANIGIFTILNLIAEDQGYFEEHGLDAEITEYDSGATSMGALLSDRADVAIAADFVGVSNFSADHRLRVLARVSDHDVFRVMARRDQGIASPADLRGKSIGVTRKTAGEYYLGQFLTRNGLTISDVTLVDLPPAVMIDRLMRKELDAIVTFEPHAYEVERSLGDTGVVWSAQGDERAFGIVYATEPFIEAHPGVAKRYLSALVQAEEYVREHESEAKAFVGKALQYEDAYLEQIWPEFTFAVGLDKDMLLSMENQMRWLIRNGLTDRTEVPNLLDDIYFPAVEAVKPAAVTIAH